MYVQAFKNIYIYNKHKSNLIFLIFDMKIYKNAYTWVGSPEDCICLKVSLSKPPYIPLLFTIIIITGSLYLQKKEKVSV